MVRSATSSAFLGPKTAGSLKTCLSLTGRRSDEIYTAGSLKACLGLVKRRFNASCEREPDRFTTGLGRGELLQFTDLAVVSRIWRFRLGLYSKYD